MTIKELAIKHMTAVRSPLFENREKINTSAVVNMVVHIERCDFIDDPKKPYTVVWLKEFPGNFLFGGTVLTRLLTELLTEFNDLDTLNAALEADPLAIKMFNAKAKQPNPVTGMVQTYTAVEIVDE